MSRRLVLVLVAVVAAAIPFVLPADDVGAETPVPAPAAAPAAVPAPADVAPPSADSPFENVKVLTHVTTKQEMRRIMKEQAAALGVKCSHCHVRGDFASDEKSDKRVAREMMRMVAQVNATFLKDFEDGGVTCWTCHRGATEPEREVSAEALAAQDAMTGEPAVQPAPEK